MQATDAATRSANLRWRDAIVPRRELMILSSTLLEICWTFGFFALALEATGNGQRGVTVFTYATLVFVAIYSTRFLLNSYLPQNLKQGFSIAIALCAILIVIRGTLYSGFALLDISWLIELPSSILNLFIIFSPVSLVVGMGVYAWWRGLSLAQASYDFESVGFRFRLGVLMLALLALLNTWIAHFDISGLLVAFFFFGLLAVALARQEEVGRAESSVSLPLRGPWLGILIGSVLLVLGLAALLAALLTPQGVRAVANLLRPLEPIIILILYVFLLLISLIVELVFNAVLFIIQRFINPNIQASPFQLSPRPTFDFAQTPPDLSALAAYWDPARSLCAIVLFVGVLFLLALSLNRMQRRKRDDAGAQRESVPVVIANPLKRLRQLFKRPNLAVDDSDMATIRRIYANLTRLAAERGFPRRSAETPYEFMGELREALPNVVSEERAITEAYVKVHYGELSPSGAELAKVQEAWKIIREKGKHSTP